MYQVLYRKWRPLKFSDVSGQEQVTITLKNALKTNRINHAYLFTGSRGTGKTTCAKILAKAVNCLKPVDGDPCGECENCVGIESGEILDVLEIDAASNNGVENIRTLIEESVFTPSKAKFRVYIIDEVHMLSIGAFNALLKTLEEPPSHVVFILATTEVHKIPATILSRCQRFDFNKISADAIAKRLIYVSENENTDIDYDAAFLIASLSDGALRDALSLLDRCISNNTHITTQVVRQISGLASSEYLYAIVDSVVKKECSQALNMIDELNNKSKDMTKLCEELISHFRNLMLIKTMKNAKELVILTNDEFENSLVQANSISINEIIYAMDTLQMSLEKIHKGSNKRTELEICLIKLCSPKFDTSMDALLSRIATLERAVKKGITVVSTKDNIEVKEFSNEDTIIEKKDKSDKEDYNEFAIDENETSSSNTTVLKDNIKPVKNTHPVLERAKSQNEENQTNISETTNKIDSISEAIKNAKPMEDWQDVIEILRKKSKTIASAFDGTSAYISGKYLLIDSKYDITIKLLKQSAQREEVRKAILEVTGKKFNLGPYKSSESNKDKIDPLEELTKKIKESGITLNQSENK